MRNSLLFYVKLFVGYLLSMPIQQTSAQFQVDFEYRPRFEFRDGYKTLASEADFPSFIITQRSRVTLSYQNENIRIKFAPQDVRVWGDELLYSSTGVYGDIAALDLHEASAELRFGRNTWISIGRQELVYDNERLLAKRNWNQNGLSYDAVVLKSKIGDWSLHAGATWNSLSETKTENHYPPDRIKTLDYVWFNKKISDVFQISLSHIASGFTETDSTNDLHFRHTSGFYIEQKLSNITFHTDMYYQFGSNKSGDRVSALLGDLDLTWNTGTINPGLGASCLSGNSSSSGSTDHLFDILYGARHRFFGHMDYFNNISGSTKNAGLIDLYGYLGLKLNKSMKVKDTGHLFHLATTNNNTPLKKFLGYENEVEFAYKFNDCGTLKIAYLIYLPTDSFKFLQGTLSASKFSQFAFLELCITPSLLIDTRD